MTHWDKHAKNWAHLGAPLCRSAEDTAIAVSWLRQIIPSTQQFNVLVLGVTPELVQLPWQHMTRLIAVDNNIAMLQHVLPRSNVLTQQIALQGNWLQLPLCEASIDLVIGDGCYSVFAQQDYQVFSAEVYRVLRPEGHFIMRFYAKPVLPDSIEKIKDDFLAGNIRNFNAFKWRLAMSLQQQFCEGVCLHDIWQCWQAHFKKHVNTLQQLNWTEEVQRGIEHYRHSEAHYTFPTYDEVMAEIEPYFQKKTMQYPAYILGERCPSMWLCKI